MVPAETGENEVVYCESGRYAANIEKANSQGPLVATPTASTGQTPEKFPTPGVLTIEALSAAPYHVAAPQQIKTLIYLVEGKLVIVLLRGDDQLNEAKFAGRLGTATFRSAMPAEIVEAMGAHPGSLGAVTATRRNTGLRVLADEALRGAAGMTTGANEDGFHLRHVDIARDIRVDEWADFRTVQAGELCVATGQPLNIRRPIEVRESADADPAR